MPRFFLHLKSGEELIEDFDGSELAGLEAARLQAIDGIRELLGAAIKAGNSFEVEGVVIHNERGDTVAFVPVAEALPPQLRHARHRPDAF